MKKLRIIAAAVAFAMFTSFVPVSARSFTAVTTEDDITNAQIDAYFESAGYPQNVLALLSESTKATIFERKMQYDASSIVHGILTENQKITFTIDTSGLIQINDDNKAELEKLLSNDAQISKILYDKQESAKVKRAKTNTYKQLRLPAGANAI